MEHDYEAEMDAFQILKVLVLFPVDDSDGWCSDEMYHFLDIFPRERFTAAIQWLFDRGLASIDLENIWLTTKGDLHYQQNKDNATIPLDLVDFRNEALTGLRAQGGRRTDGDWQRSEMDNVALPRGQMQRRQGGRQERALLKKEEANRQQTEIAYTFGLTVAEYQTQKQSGTIRVCNGGGTPHMGRFHKGHRVCAACRKTKSRG
jgi:hypothetical protein